MRNGGGREMRMGLPLLVKIRGVVRLQRWKSGKRKKTRF